MLFLEVVPELRLTEERLGVDTLFLVLLDVETIPRDPDLVAWLLTADVDLFGVVVPTGEVLVRF